MSVSSQGFTLYRPLSRRRSKIKNKRHVWACRREQSPGSEQIRRVKRDAPLDWPGTGFGRPSAAYIDFKKIERSDLRIYRGGDLPMSG